MALHTFPLGDSPSCSKIGFEPRHVVLGLLEVRLERPLQLGRGAPFAILGSA